MKAAFLILCTGAVVCTVSAGTISLVADTTLPDPNDEITIWVQTDEPLMCLGLAVYVTGDAAITTAMSEADCAAFGWDNGWNSDPYIDPNGWIYLSGVRWVSDANDIVSYFKFRYYSGQVSVYIDQENSIGFSWDGNTVTYSTLSIETLLFGEPTESQLQESDSEETAIDDDPVPNVSAPKPKSLEECISRTAYFNDEKTTSSVESLNEFANHKQRRETAFLEQSISLSTEQSQNEAVSELRETLLESPESVIEVSPGNVPTVWTKDNTYHVTGTVVLPPACYFEPGVHVSRAPNSRMVSDSVFPPIMCGTPEEKIWMYPDADPYYYGHYVSGIEYTDLAGTLEMRHVIIEGAYYGVIFENCTFNNDIHDLYLFNNVYGIYADGNEDLKFSLILAVGNYYTGIEVYLEAGCDIKITQSTIDYSPWDGIIIAGTVQATDCTAIVANTAITRCGLGPNPYAYGVQTFGYLYAAIYGMGYYGNSNDNPAGFIEYYDVHAPSLPYESNGTLLGSHYLKKTSPFYNGGVGYVTETPQILICTTSTDNTPLTGVLPIGFCYAIDPNFTNEGLGYVLETDVDNSKGVDFEDFAAISKYWLLDLDPNSFDPNSVDPNDIDPHVCDFDGNKIIDIGDLIKLSEEWLQFGSGVPQLALLPDNDPNGNGQYTILSNSIEFSLVNQMEGYDYYLFRDGHYISKFKGNVDLAETSYASDDTFKAVNGQHRYRVAACSRNERLTVVSKAMPYELSNTLHGVVSSKVYDPNHPYIISGFNNSAELLIFKLFNMEEAVVWDANIPSGSFSLTIDPNVFYTPLVTVPAMINPYCTYLFTNPEIQMLMQGATSFEDAPGWSSTIVEKFNIRTWRNRGTKSLLIAPNRGIFRARATSNHAWCQAMRNRNLVPITGLFGDAATREAQDFMFNDPSLRSIRINTHGAFQIRAGGRTVRRTVYELGDGTLCFSWIASANQNPPNPADFLPGDYEQTGYSIRSARNWSALPYLYVDADFCASGRARMPDAYYKDICDAPEGSGYYNDDDFWNGMDMARWAFDIRPMGETRRRIYLGWYTDSGDNMLGLTGLNNWYMAFYASWGKETNPQPYYGAHSHATTSTTRGPEVHRQKTYCGNSNSYLSN
ncbi:MAG TPA: hypothetical protein PK052_12260 [Anaerohalosphaeraceae bacterium]|nr:hypothetical protein [Anaerohalosphaeraceae bacterium]HOM77324.1 hypothetical protein [Anaerohalosphaeraceae bacterium]HPC65511.1 hypothetical protein [Anaerohalosphaeraceae bacterium]HRS72694.1 hypothetical protein [Anaerohalosphaeraceae bacterium]